MSQIDPRIDKILKYRNWAIIFNGIIVSYLTYILFAFYFEFSIPGFIISLVSGSFFVRVLNIIATAIIQYRVYHGDIKQLHQDAQVAVKVFENRMSGVTEHFEEKSITIEGMPEVQLGKFMDVPFYEWLDITGADKIKKRFFFSGTMDISNGISFAVPPGNILFPPGILYEIEKPINTPV